MHSKTGRPINVGDQLVYKNGCIAAAGVVVATQPASTSCNVQVLSLSAQYPQSCNANETVHVEDAFNAPAYVPPAPESAPVAQA